MKVITFSRVFPKAHPRAGEPTLFVEKILMTLRQTKLFMRSKCSELARAVFDENHPMYYIDTFDEFKSDLPKLHTIRAGNRFKEGDKASLRVWSDKPYRSKQIEFAQVDIVKTYEFFFHTVDNDVLWELPGIGGGDFGAHSMGLKMIAQNDGLEVEDFIAWFACHPKKKAHTFTGQIICWQDPKY